MHTKLYVLLLIGANPAVYHTEQIILLNSYSVSILTWCVFCVNMRGGVCLCVCV